MDAGLTLKTKKRGTIRWVLLVSISVLMLVSIYYGLQWFTTGSQPPLMPLPARALADTSIDESPVTTQAIDSYAVPPSHPRYISIPALGIKKTRVQTIGVTKDSMLDTPKNIADTAWYEKSALPGQGYGSVIINGHNGGVTRDGVFAKLDTLKQGSEIIIERGDGIQVRYTVINNETMSLEETNRRGMKELMTPRESAVEELGLITCAGNWVPRDKMFDKRILVRAVIER